MSDHTCETCREKKPDVAYLEHGWCCNDCDPHRQAQARVSELESCLESLIRASEWEVKCLMDLAVPLPVRNLDEVNAAYQSSLKASRKCVAKSFRYRDEGSE